MNKTARIQKRLILMIAFSIIWIFIGSLVIFHQEQVLGKTFKWHQTTFVVPKSKEKSVSNYQKQGHPGSDSVDMLFTLTDDDTASQVNCQPCFTLPFPWHERDVNHYLSSSLASRAPPVA